MMRTYNDEDIARLVPFPSPQANKYTRGKLTLVVGSPVYPGAAVLASMAAQRAGAGYTEAYVEDSIVPQIQMARPSLVVHPWNRWDASQCKPCTEEHPCAFVMGCGFDPQDPYLASIVRRLLRAAQAPVLIDGGALGFMSSRKVRELCRERCERGYATIVTPHAGEATTLAGPFGLATDDPEQLALDLSRAYGVTVVLKGPDTLVSDGDGLYRMSRGTAALAKAGTGDVLAGITGALLAQGLDPVDACVLGTTLHARAASLAETDLSAVSVCAEDVIEYLPKAVLAVLNREYDE